MEATNLMRYYSLLEKLIVELTEQDGKMDLHVIYDLLTEICKMFGISKGSSCFYQTLSHERNGDGVEMVCYDSGEESRVEMHIRIITKVMAVVTCTAYMPVNAPSLSEEDRRRLDLVMRIVLGSVSRIRLQRAVEQYAFHDDKGYRNMRAFLRMLGRMNETKSLGGSVAVNYNLRHFSLVNQEIGRIAGDVVMRNHFEGLVSLIGDTGTVCRMGGDNFVLICGKDKIDAVVNYLTETPVIYEPNQHKRILISASAGVFPIPESFVLHDPGQIMDKIISSLQAARSGGKERIVYFHSTMIADKEHAKRIQQRFPDALRNGEFQVYYQPKIDILTGELAGAEALCRWFRKGRMISPNEFIPILEETTDICRLDFYMLDHVCRDIRRWLDAGKQAVRVSVNLSRKHMMDIDLLQSIIEIIDRHRVPHQYIEIELTETTTDVEFRDLKRVVGGLQQAGIYTSVDDFGIGYSSLNLISEIPWNVLKVDRSFLPGDEDDRRSNRSIMFKYVVVMAKALGMECIAEGVETERQLEVLRNNRCDLAQGFLFDHPLTVHEFESRLNGHLYAVENAAAKKQ
ncbi:MAG TPA: GGDEF domain-containing protein [Ruminococcus sp.]|nr:GGDEF domain-containing protein [Ruminococcus sp.]